MTLKFVHLKSVVLLLALLCIGNVLAQDNRTRQEIFDQIVRILNANQNELKLPDSGLDKLINELCFNGEGSITDSMRVMIESIADDPFVHLSTRKVAVDALRLFTPAEEIDRVRYLIQQDGIKIESAVVLAEWGYWEEAKQVLVEHGAWRSLVAFGNRSEVERIVRSAITDESLPLMSRLYASSALVIYGDSLTERATARQILLEYLVENKEVIDIHDLSRAVSSSCNILGESNETEDLYLFESGLTYPYSNIRVWTARALSRAAIVSENAVATEILQRAKIDTEYPEVRKIAREATDKANSPMKGDR